MSERVYVALDLETTGFDARADAIIEIGAVRFAYDDSRETCRILERFVTFVNPQRPIPLRVQQLTGIHDADVAKGTFSTQRHTRVVIFRHPRRCRCDRAQCQL